MNCRFPAPFLPRVEPAPCKGALFRRPRMICKRIVMHIGMGKPGSSSIRPTLATHCDDKHVHSVHLGQINAIRSLAAAFVDDPTRCVYCRQIGLEPSAVPTLRADALRVLDLELTKTDGRTAILSAEAASRFNLDECRSLATHLARYTNNLRAVAYVRRPKRRMVSNFQQKVKASVVRKLPVENALRDYPARFEPIDLGFGRDRVDLGLFDPARFPRSDAVLHFCR